MTELLKVASARGEIQTQVIFFHGLGGHPRETWLKAGTEECWLGWLSEDLEGVAVWSVGYDASLSRWKGYATHLIDRGTSVIHRLIAEPALSSGQLALVGHSLGGLVIKQALRKGEELESIDSRAAELLQRVTKVAFLATPHSGSDHALIASMLQWVLLPSAATMSLLPDDPYLRSLNEWYRTWSARNEIRNLILTEARSQGWKGILGKIVRPSSADPGLETNPLPIDASHTEICKPVDRAAEAYVFLRSFIASPAATRIGIRQQLAAELEGATDKVIARISAAIPQTLTDHSHSAEPADQLIHDRLTRLKKSRFIHGFDVRAEALRLAQAVEKGELAGGSPAKRGLALAWCARLLLGDVAEAERLTGLARTLTQDVSVIFADAFLLAKHGHVSDGLALLAPVEEPSARSAGLFVVALSEGDEAALNWASEAGIGPARLDSDGKHALLSMLLGQSKWSEAAEVANQLEDIDFSNTPSLLRLAAFCHLVQAVPEELRAQALMAFPLDAANYPLSLSERGLAEIRKAAELFERFEHAAANLGCDEAKLDAGEYALWLRLRDPQEKSQAIAELKNSLRQAEHSVRRLPLAAAFQIKLDFELVERELRTREALAGKPTVETAHARLAVALAQQGADKAAEYIAANKDRMVPVLGIGLVLPIQISLLVKSGAVDQAQDLVDQLRASGEAATEIDRLQEQIDQSTHAKIEPLIKRFQESKRVVDLAGLVDALEAAGDSRLSTYSLLLLDEIEGLPQAETAARAQFAAGFDSNVIQIGSRFPHFLEASERLLEVTAWAYYRVGDLRKSYELLRQLKSKRDTPNDRALDVNLAVSSGAWSRIHSIVEHEWQHRADRSARELMGAADLSAAVKASRTRDLIQAAIEKDADDPGILYGAYVTATRLGWDDNEEVSKWLQKAAERSDPDGPVQRLSLRELLDKQPQWEKQQADVAKAHAEGAIPIFVVAQLMNRSLVDLLLLPALLNQEEADIRNTVVIPAYSPGSGRPISGQHIIGLDPSALLTLGALGLLNQTASAFERLVIPHGTLQWLFQERRKVEFHQPSRISSAKALQRLIASGLISEFRGSGDVDKKLESEVGGELAKMLHYAAAQGPSHVVLRGGPIHRADSLMEEEADVSAYVSVLRSCQALVQKLTRRGLLTASEEARAKAYLESQEQQWPSQEEIPDGATVLIDDIALSYIQHLKLLEKAPLAGLNLQISPDAVKESLELIKYEHQASRVSEVIEEIREFLEKKIEEGVIELGALQDDQRGDLGAHPSFGAIKLAGKVQSLVSDDRFVNKLQTIEEPSGVCQVVSTLSLLALLRSTGKISEHEWRDAMTQLRRSQYVCVPVGSEELANYLATTSISEHGLIENGELRAIRENILRLRMTNFLRVPTDMPWLMETLQTLIREIGKQWESDADAAVAEARANWLLELSDVRGWAHRYPEGAAQGVIEKLYPALVMMLSICPSSLFEERQDQYEAWADARIFEPMAEEAPNQLEFIATRARQLAEGKAISSPIAGE